MNTPIQHYEVYPVAVCLHVSAVLHYFDVHFAVNDVNGE